MRTKNSLKNIKYNVVFFIINFILMFLLKRIFIIYLGDEITGLNALFQNIIGFLNIAELGIVNAVTYSLYKPLKEENYNKINSILITYRYIYRLVALFIFVGSIILTLFIQNFINGTSVNISLIRIYFMLVSLITVISYLITYIQVVIVADQKGYVVSKTLGNFNILKILVQILAIKIYKSYILWILVELIFNFIAFECINLKVRKEYKWINLNNTKSLKMLFNENKSIFLNTKDLFFHKLGFFVLNQTDNLVISAFTTIKNVMLYSNYLMIINVVKGLLTQIFRAISASIGNLVAEKDDNKSYIIWREIHIIISLLSVVVCYCVYKMINLLIQLWIGQDYLLNYATIICIIINLYFSLTRQTIDVFKDAYGIFWDVWSPILEAIINLIISIYLVKKLGIMGVVIGTNISNFIIIAFWRPYILFKEGFKSNLFKFYTINFKIAIITMLSLGISNKFIDLIFCNFVSITWGIFIIKCFIALMISFSLTVLISLIFSEFRRTNLKYFKIVINGILKNNV
ncbi:lipopolysaccharide biosynthesis protein [Clostridium sporogenes]|uniref:lipopolysaccharide biosynthesis protein n=1 Tax=Clostridium sporogenes TaxID=1509 RepID=UPI0028FEA16F|nr:hypothetical protein [Clostridium botulinum]